MLSASRRVDSSLIGTVAERASCRPLLKLDAAAERSGRKRLHVLNK